MPCLTRQTLADQGCGTPFCGHDHTVLFLHSRCHVNGGTSVSYDKRTGELTIVCARCKTLVAKVKVAEE
jgi:hypothetical protein